MDRLPASAAIRKQAKGIVLAIGMVWASGRVLLFVTIALVVIEGTLPIASLYALKVLIDSLEQALTSGSPEPSGIRILVLTGIIGLLALTSAIAHHLSSYLGNVQANTVTDYVQSKIHEKSIEIDLEYYEDPQFHNALYRAQTETPNKPASVVSNMLLIGQNMSTLIGLIVLLVLNLEWYYAVVLVAVSLPGGIVGALHSRAVYDWKTSRAEEERRASYFNYLITGMWYTPERKFLDLGATFVESYRALRKKLREEHLKLVRKRTYGEVVAHSVQVIVIFGLLASLALQTSRGETTIGDLVLCLQAFQRANDVLRQLMRGLANLYDSNMYLSQLHQFLQFEPKVREPVCPRRFPKALVRGLEFDDVSFTYPSTERAALCGVSFHVKPGERVAFVGLNGAGKSTLVKLMCRLYDPLQGSVKLDGIDIRDFSISELRRQIGVVFQDYVRYELSVRKSIHYGEVGAVECMARMEAAAAAANADSFIRALPHKYDTVVGHLFEGAEQLSVGQWQRLALARLFFRSAQIVVMDEPFSFLDPMAEEDIFRRFLGENKAKAAIVVSHRMSTVKMVDRIFVLNDGRVVESGSHDNLLKAGGLYAEFFEVQSLKYR